MQLPRPLRGIITAMVTPLRSPSTLDVGGLERLVEHLIAGGVHGVFVLGTTGEAPALSYALREEVIRRVCHQVSGRIPVVVGVTDTSFDEAVALSEKAAESGAQAVVAAPPYYYQLTQDDLLRYCTHLASAVPIPLMLYNAPSNTHHVFAVSTVLRAAQVPNIVGIKDSGFNMGYFHSLREGLKNDPEFTLLVGPEELMAEAVLLGGHGGMCAGSNVYPQLFVDLYDAAASHGMDRVLELQSEVMRFGQNVYRAAEYDANPLRGMKCALKLLGICEEGLTEPLAPYTRKERDCVRQYLEECFPKLALRA